MNDTPMILYRAFPCNRTVTTKVAGIYVVKLRRNKAIQAVGYSRLDARMRLLARMVSLSLWEGMLFPSRDFAIGDRVKIVAVYYWPGFGTVTGISQQGGVWVRRDNALAYQIFSPQEIRKLFPWEY